MVRYTSEELRDIYAMRGIRMKSNSTKKQLTDGFTYYNKLARMMLDIIFEHTCLTGVDGALAARVNAIKTQIANLFGEPALDTIEYYIYFLEKTIWEYSSMLELVKHYRKNIPMPVRECTLAKMAQDVIDAIEDFESSLGLPPYPKTEAISAIKRACPKGQMDLKNLESLVNWLKVTSKYYKSIAKYIY